MKGNIDLLESEIPEYVVIIFRKMKISNLARMIAVFIFSTFYIFQLIDSKEIINIWQVCLVLILFVYMAMLTRMHFKINKTIATDNISDINIFFEGLAYNWYFYIGIFGFIIFGLILVTLFH
jgi:hypothetical protein